MNQVIIYIISGIIFLFLGHNIGLKGKVNFIHSYHYKNVKDIRGYTKNMGVGYFILGSGLLIASIISILGYQTQSSFVIVLVIIISFSWLIRVQIKFGGKILP